MVPILNPAFAGVRIANEIRMQFRRERKNGQTVSLQEALEIDGESALTLTDVLQDSFCMEDSYEKKEDIRRLRQLLETLPARERQILLLRYGIAGQPPLTQMEVAALLHISRSYVSHPACCTRLDVLVYFYIYIRSCPAGTVREEDPVRRQDG